MKHEEGGWFPTVPAMKVGDRVAFTRVSREQMKNRVQEIVLEADLLQRDRLTAEVVIDACLVGFLVGRTDSHMYVRNISDLNGTRLEDPVHDGLRSCELHGVPVFKVSLLDLLFMMRIEKP